MVGDFIFIKTIWVFDIWCLFIKIVINNSTCFINFWKGANYIICVKKLAEGLMHCPKCYLYVEAGDQPMKT